MSETQDASSIEARERRQRVDKNGNHQPVDIYMETLVGQKSTTGTVHVDPETNEPRLFFIFSDLSVRLAGEFVIQCRVLDLACPMNVVTLMTSPFEVYPLKLFKDDMKATSLSKALSLQGFVC